MQLLWVYEKSYIFRIVNINICSNVSGRQPSDYGWIQLKQVKIKKKIPIRVHIIVVWWLWCGLMPGLAKLMSLTHTSSKIFLKIAWLMHSQSFVNPFCIIPCHSKKTPYINPHPKDLGQYSPSRFHFHWSIIHAVIYLHGAPHIVFLLREVCVIYILIAWMDKNWKN